MAGEKPRKAGAAHQHVPEARDAERAHDQDKGYLQQPHNKGADAKGAGARGGQGMRPLTALGAVRPSAGGQTAARRAHQAAAGCAVGAAAGAAAQGQQAEGQAQPEPRQRAAAAAAAGAGAKRKPEEVQAASGGRKQARTTAAEAAAAAPIQTDRDGVPTLDGLRAWAAAQLAAIQEKASTAFSQQCNRAVEAGFNSINERVKEHHTAVSAMLEASNAALETARQQHAAAMTDLEAVRDGVLEDLEGVRSELLQSLRTDVLAAVEAGLAGAQVLRRF